MMLVTRLKAATGKKLMHVVESTYSDKVLLVFEDMTVCQIGADPGWDSDIEIVDVQHIDISDYDPEQFARATSLAKSNDIQQPWSPEMWQGMFWMLLNTVANSPFCRCGKAPYTHGQRCPTCVAIVLRESIKSKEKAEGR